MLFGPLKGQESICGGLHARAVFTYDIFLFVICKRFEPRVPGLIGEGRI